MLRQITTDDNKAKPKNPIPLWVVLLICGLCYSLISFLNWRAEQNAASLIALKREDVVQLVIFESTNTSATRLVKLTDFKDEFQINEFLHAINTSKPSNDVVGRDLLINHELAIVIRLRNNRDIELLLHLHKSCEPTVYMSIVKRYFWKDSSMTSGRGVAKSDGALYKWLQNLSLSYYLGCEQ